MYVAIYCDKGTSAVGVGQLQYQCAALQWDSALVTADDIIHKGLSDFTMFVMPGGADVPYHNALHGAGNKEIRAFVENGGVYMGICAGAYYAHNAIEWHNTTESITEDRELGFFNGVAKGPLVKPYLPNCNDSAVYVYTQCKEHTIQAHYNGGPILYVDGDTQVIADFIYCKNIYPAVIKKAIGKGWAVGISPHIEYGDNHCKTISAPICEKRDSFFKFVMESLECF